tara:strand:- start:1550 stop:1897 length:348 start_codon:yes stop_codon:yes gene_type:complete
MYYIKLEDDDCNKISYYCRNCGDSNNELMEESKCILKENITRNENKFNISINKYTKLDNTLPRINYIKCPNENCDSNTEKFDVTNREIIYIRYDHINMKYMYLCSHCDFIWNTEK